MENTLYNFLESIRSIPAGGEEACKAEGADDNDDNALLSLFPENDADMADIDIDLTLDSAVSSVQSTAAETLFQFA